MRRWRGAATALVAATLAIATVELAWPARPDFPPFVMTIEDWNSQRVGLSDGRRLAGTYVHRLEYRRRDDWSLTLVFDEIPGYSKADDPYDNTTCRNGVYGHVDRGGVFHERSRDPGFCNGVGRWIHYGIAWRYPWRREVAGDTIVYTDPGERVVFDARTGLPLLYEAGPVDGPVGERTKFRLDRWGTP